MTTIRSHKRLKRFGNPELLKSLVPNRSAWRPVVKFALLLLAFVALIVMLARPQTMLKEGSESKSGIEIAFVLDVSNSMLAEDVNPNRLERAKLLISTMLDRNEHDNISLGVFAGEAYPQLPMTNDHGAAKLFLDAIHTDMVTLQGTNMKAAIELGATSFTEKNKGGKAVVLITDAEDHEQGAIEAAKAAAKNGIRVYVLGIGSENGATIPTDGGMLTDQQGNVVKTALNAKVAQEIATAGKGEFYRVDQSTTAQERLLSSLNQLEKATSAADSADYGEQFVAFGIIALVLLIAEFMLNETKNKWWEKHKVTARQRQ